MCARIMCKSAWKSYWNCNLRAYYALPLPKSQSRLEMLSYEKNVCHSLISGKHERILRADTNDFALCFALRRMCCAECESLAPSAYAYVCACAADSAGYVVWMALGSSNISDNTWMNGQITGLMIGRHFIRGKLLYTLMCIHSFVYFRNSCLI